MASPKDKLEHRFTLAAHTDKKQRTKNGLGRVVVSRATGRFSLPQAPLAVETAPWGGTRQVECCRTPTYVGVFATTHVIACQ